MSRSKNGFAKLRASSVLPGHPILFAGVVNVLRFAIRLGVSRVSIFLRILVSYHVTFSGIDTGLKSV